jgi:hypothetical protein
MIKKLLYKIFGLTPDTCASCELLRDLLEKSEGGRSELLHKLLEREKPEQVVQQTEEFQPIKPQHVPWRVRQQMLEAEDRKQAALLRQNAQDIASLEKELGVTSTNREEHAIQK